MDNDCFLGHACLERMCKVGCSTNKDCPMSQNCIQNKCQDPCSTDQCGPNSQCQVLNQETYCICKPGFIPNPSPEIACTKVPSFCIGNKQCPENFLCVESFCKAVCQFDHDCDVNELCHGKVCKEVCTHDSQCQRTEICQGMACISGCRSNLDCPDTQGCHNGKCIGKKSFEKDRQSQSLPEVSKGAFVYSYPSFVFRSL